AVRVTCFRESGLLCSIKNIVRNRNFPIEETVTVFEIERTGVINFMVKSQLGRIALRFVFFKKAMYAIAFSLNEMNVSTDTVFNGCIYSEIQFCFIIEINEQFWIEYIPVKFWNCGKVNARRVISPVAVV